MNTVTVKYNALTAEEVIFLWETVWGDGQLINEMKSLRRNESFSGFFLYGCRTFSKGDGSGCSCESSMIDFVCQNERDSYHFNGVFRINSTPRVFLPQWEDTVQPAQVSRIS